MSDEQTIVHFKRWKCIPKVKHYNNDAIAVVLLDHESYEPIAVATVNLPDVILPEDDILIKNWSENAGVYQAMHSAGYVGPVKERIPTGFTHALQVSMTSKLRDLIPTNNPQQEAV